MIITLELLQEKKPYQGMINYFKSLGKQEWEAMELVKKCIEDKTEYAGWLFETFKLTGLCETFNENGNLWEKCYYQKGKLHGECEYFYPNGNLWITGNYKEGEWHGESKYFHPNGHVYLSCYHKEGQLDGECKYFDENGHLIRTDYYEEGQIVKIVES
jgi:antitoxin component YwqK of YwqJK toxin-antitoxin module